MYKKFVVALTALVLTSAQAFTPPRVVNVVIGYGPGSGNENSFRGVAAIVEKNNPGVNFVVQNRPGGDEVIALNYFSKLPPDGANIYIPSQQAVFTTTEIWHADQLQARPMDLSLVLTIAKSPMAVIANVNSRTSTPQELLQRMRSTQEPVSFALGSSGHKLIFEYLMDKGRGNDSKVKSVMYRGPAQALQDVASGQVEFGIMPSAIAYSMYRAGKIKYIGLTSEFKLAALPDVPLWKDSGMPGLNIYAGWVMALPPGTPSNIVKYYQDLFVPAIRSLEARQFFDANLMFAVPGEQSPEGVRDAIVKLREVWMPYVRRIKFD